MQQRNLISRLLLLSALFQKQHKQRSSSPNAGNHFHSLQRDKDATPPPNHDATLSAVKESPKQQMDGNIVCCLRA